VIALEQELDDLSRCSPPKCIQQWNRTSQQLHDIDIALDCVQMSTSIYVEVSSLDNLVDYPLDLAYCAMFDAEPISCLLQL